jgi:hypothetical protein
MYYVCMYVCGYYVHVCACVYVFMYVCVCIIYACIYALVRYVRMRMSFYVSINVFL